MRNSLSLMLISCVFTSLLFFLGRLASDNRKSKRLNSWNSHNTGLSNRKHNSYSLLCWDSPLVSSNQLNKSQTNWKVCLRDTETFAPNIKVYGLSSAHATSTAYFSLRMMKIRLRLTGSILLLPLDASNLSLC